MLSFKDICRAVESGRAFVIRSGKRFDLLSIGSDMRAWLSGTRNRMYLAKVSLDEIQIA
jgi:hypothetical protein